MDVCVFDVSRIHADGLETRTTIEIINNLEGLVKSIRNEQAAIEVAYVKWKEFIESNWAKFELVELPLPKSPEQVLAGIVVPATLDKDKLFNLSHEYIKAKSVVLARIVSVMWDTTTVGVLSNFPMWDAWKRKLCSYVNADTDLISAMERLLIEQG